MVNELLQGAIEVHVHATPDIGERASDFIALAREYRQAGFAGVLIKDHFQPSTDRAYALNHLGGDGFRVWGGLVLNRPVGGFNPTAVAVAVERGARVVFMPTSAARNHLIRVGRLLPPYDRVRVMDAGDEGMTIFGPGGSLLPEVVDIIDQVIAARRVLGTGHLSPDECIALAETAQARGSCRILVNHASHYISNLSVADQRRMVALGALIEHSWVATKHQHHPIRPEAIAEQIRAVGAEHCILSSDYGQPRLGSPVAGFRDMVATLLDLGITPEEIRTMIHTNPRRLLEEVN